MISICNLESRKILYRLSGHYLYPNCLAFSPNSQILASSGGDGLIKLWNLKTGYLLRTLADPLWNLESLREDTRGFIYSVRHLSFNPQGDMVASAGWDKNIKLWNTNNGQLIRTLTGHKDAVNSVAFSPDGQILASGSNDMTIKLWEVNTGKEICTLKGHTGFINCVAFSPDDQVLASGSNDKTIKIWRWD
jgi:WD40 repeat protein